MAAQAAHSDQRLFPRPRFSANGGAPMPPVTSGQVIEPAAPPCSRAGGLTECPMATFEDVTVIGLPDPRTDERCCELRRQLTSPR